MAHYTVHDMGEHGDSPFSDWRPRVDSGSSTLRRFCEGSGHRDQASWSEAGVRLIRSRRPHAARSITAMLLILAFGEARQASAWKYHEHTAVGRESYRCACLWLLEDIGARTSENGVCPLTVIDGATGRPVLNDGQKKNELTKSLIRDVMCTPTQLDTLVERYGQATALAGDHLGDPKEFEYIDGQRNTVSIVVYALRALSDGDHFHPRSPLLWSEWHLEALRAARSARAIVKAKQRATGAEAPDDLTNASEPLRQLFFRMLYVNAFGDHFLQDAFAAGHMGSNRGATRPTAAQVFHDKHNRLGRVVRDARGCVWLTHGDGQLHWFHSGRDELLAAAAFSVYDALYTFATGLAEPQLTEAVRERLPTSYCSASAADCRAQLPKRRRTCAQSREHGSASWRPLAAMHNPAMVKFAPGVEYRHAFDFQDGGYLRNQFNLVASFPISTAYGVRVEVAAGVITPALRPSSATSLYTRGGLVVPIHADYGSALSIDLALGGFNEVCIDQCALAPGVVLADYDRGLAGAFLGPRVNLEIGRIILIQGFVEPFLGADYGGRGAAGLGLGVTLSKGSVVNEPTLFPGPLL
jgi:hypothetical protein